MAQTSNEDTNKNQNIASAIDDANSNFRSDYDAGDFLYNAVPFGEYPEVTAADIRNKTADTTKNQK